MQPLGYAVGKRPIVRSSLVQGVRKERSCGALRVASFTISLRGSSPRSRLLTASPGGLPPPRHPRLAPGSTAPPDPPNWRFWHAGGASRGDP
eukprot:15448354-Alexandrium_andersonii.AAC.1